jgi:hypothetical protein
LRRRVNNCRNPNRRYYREKFMKTIVLLTLVFFAGLGQLARAAVDVTVFRIEDNRSVEFGDDHVSRTLPGMKILLSLRGPEAESSIRYGDLKLDEAVDDQGNSLIPGKSPFNDPAKFKDYANSFFRNSKFGNQTKPADPQAELDLAQPKRAAIKIARLRGSLTLADSGTIQSVELGNLKNTGKQALALPADAHLGVTVDVASGDNVHSIGIEITGDEKILESIEVVDASGKKISTGMSSWSVNDGPAHKSLELGRPVDDTMKLVAKFSLDRKLTTVPFDLRDIPLP